MPKFRGKTNRAVLVLKPGRSGLLPEETVALQRLCNFWSTNPRLGRLIWTYRFETERPSKEWASELSGQFTVRTGSMRSINVHLHLPEEQMLKNLLKKLAKTVAHTLNQLLANPQADIEEIFFDFWNT